MKMNLFYSNLLICIPILLMFPLVYSSTSCSIFSSLNCSCFQSNVDLNLSSPMKTYSHLHCQGNSLTEKTFQSPFGVDFKHQNRFRTISIEFFIENRVEILSNQLNSLSILLSKTNNDTPIDLSLRFNGFTHITFHEESLTSKIFHRGHANKRLFLSLIPARSNLTEIELDEENSTNIEDQFNFFPNCFSGLIVSQLTIYIHTIRDRFPSSFSFEQIFNNTNIGELHFHGSIIRPSEFPISETYKSLIRSLTLHRHVDTIDSNTFPFYPDVFSYTIHSIEAHSMNLSSFLPSHTNLRGLEIIKPRFDVIIDQLIPTLDSLTLDVEYLNEKTLFAALHIHNLKIGSRLRTINPKIFLLLSRRLNHLDLSDIDLSQMTSESRCHLIKYLSQNSQDQLNILFPRVENLTECDCARLFLNHIQLIQNLKKNKNLICSKKCRFSDCQIISEYFLVKYPLIIKDNQPIHLINQTINDKNHFNEHLPSVDLFSDTIDVDIITFLINQTKDQETNEIQRQTTTSTTTTSINIDTENISTLANIQEYDDIISFSTPKLFEPWDDQIDKDETESFDSNKSEYFSWLAFFIGVIVVIVLLVIICIIILFIIRYRKEHHFKPVPVYV